MANGFKSGGRTKGTPNKSTAELKSIAQEHTDKAIEVLVSIMTESENDQAKIAAAKELLDRGYGKSSQYIEATIHTHEDALDELK